MTTDIDAMTPEQLRDALAYAGGWGMDGHLWLHKTSAGASCNANEGEHPIPALDTPEALGVVAAMLPQPYFCFVTQVARKWNVDAHPYPKGGRRSVYSQGPTEAIARARLVLKVRATWGEKS